MGFWTGLTGAVVGRRVQAPPALLALLPELHRVRLRSGGLPPRLGGWCLGRATVAGITLGRTIWLAPGTPWDVGLLLHELRHVQQFDADRWFPLRYVWASLTRGYSRNPYELDAVAWAGARLRDVTFAASARHSPQQEA